MNNAILKLIDSSDSKDRKRAIKALIQDGTPEALKYLAIIYKTDSDPEIRDLALKAGRYVKQQQNVSSKWEGTGAKNVPEPEPEPEDHEDYVHVSGAKQELAKSYLDQAMDASIARDKKRAFELLRKAFQTNPNLRLDSYSMNMATDITGREKDETLAMLGFGDAEVDVDSSDIVGDGDTKEKRKRKNDEADDGEVTWATALTDLAITFVVVAGIMIVGLLLALNTLAPAMRTYMQTLQTSGAGRMSSSTMTAMQIDSLFSGVMNVGVVGSIIYGLAYSFGLIIGLLIMYMLIHIAATWFMGGQGTYRGLIHRANNLHLFMYGGGLALGFIAILIILPGMFDPKNLKSISEESISGSPVMSIVYAVSFASSIIYWWWFSSAIGTNYQYSTSRGCVTIFVSNIIATVLYCGCIFAFSSALMPKVPMR